MLLAATVFALIRWPQLGMTDENLLAYVRGEFRSFSGEAFQRDVSGGEAKEDVGNELDKRRVEQYEVNSGLFLVHTWRFSEKPGQIVDIEIRLREHLDTSTRPSLLREGEVESVTYELGRRFFSSPVVKRDKQDNFALEISAYRPLLCLAEVSFNDGSPPVLLSRYIDFPTGSEANSR